MALSLKLLGEFALRDEDGVELTLPTRKTRALLAYLAVNADKPQRRERLRTLLWGDRGEQQARQSLNQALRSIRRLGEERGIALLDSEGERVMLVGAALDCDVQRLRTLVKEQPAQAAALYDGPFLDGLSIPDPAFEEWLLSTRSELHALACNALEAAADRSDDTETALRCAKRLVTLEPLRENGHRLLMRLLHASGDRAAALQQYRTCAEILGKELQVAPELATQALFEEFRRSASTPTQPEPTSARTVPPPTLLDKPSIAVLPFSNLSSDPTIDHLADGLMDDLIMALAKVRELLVIGGSSAAIYKRRNASVQEIAGALGVRYVLEGSLQTAGGRLRCTTHLVDTVRGNHVWSERYDHPIEDIFVLQDAIVWKILVELQVRLTEGDGARIASRGTRNLQAWLLRVQAAGELGRTTWEGTNRARALFQAAYEADLNWARPLAGVAACHYYDAIYGWSSSREESIAAGIDYAERAIKMDPKEPFGYVALRSLYSHLGKHDEALEIIEKALKLAPNDQLVLGNLAHQLLCMDRIDEALRVYGQMVRLGPNPHIAFQRSYGLALILANRTDDAIVVLENLARREPNWLDGIILLAAAHASVGRIGDARSPIEGILQDDPTFTASRHLVRYPFQNNERTEWLRALLVKAGVPE